MHTCPAKLRLVAARAGGLALDECLSRVDPKRRCKKLSEELTELIPPPLRFACMALSPCEKSPGHGAARIYEWMQLPLRSA